ncbi:ABC transporter substrate-binding protein [Oscillochloris sp. ZM17-4]|uniref:ABC transporter substrate-binding protein n=1 Tax=Oscillochloris sp. ZM17-4 TaxID=2866714 RepID=UPI001C72C082|nr:ABC transporter substrate-binding protein [Oscillochloris sp. ZM17-4]MBX0328713.1 ABC transporter substrate-binding protein [Oscillochloris sp. ZM17-4]
MENTTKLTRRQMLRGMIASGGVAILAACGAAPAAPAAPAATDAPAAAAPTSAPAVAAAPSATTITYWGSFSGGLGEAEAAMVKAFNESQSEVQVEYQFQGSYEETAQKFTAALQANTIPDVVLLSDVWWFSFYTAGAIAPLDDLASQVKLDFSDYEPVLLDEGVRQGKHYWVPFARSTPLFYYNKQIWQEAGLPDRSPDTWAEMADWATKLVKKDGDTISQAAFAHPNGASYIAWLFQGVVWQFNGQYSNPDFTMTMTDPNTLRAAQFYQDTVNKDKWAILSQDVNKDFTGGITASTMASTGGLAGIQKAAAFPVGVGFLPKADSFGCPTGGSGLAIPTSTPDDKKLAAMKYIAFATSTESAGVWARSTGYMPVRLSTKETPEMVTFFDENPNFKTVVDQLPLTRAQDAARVFVRNGDQIIGKGLERIIVNGESPDAVFADVNAELTKGAAPILEDLKAIEAGACAGLRRSGLRRRRRWRCR